MSKAGILVVNNRRSSIDGISLAYQEDGMDPYAAATDFMANHGCRNRDCVTVKGTQSGNDFWLDDAQKNSSDVCTGSNAEALTITTSAVVRPAAARVSPGRAVKSIAANSPAKAAKAARKATKKTAKKAVTKKSATKAAATNQSKKAAKKRGKKP